MISLRTLLAIIIGSTEGFIVLNHIANGIQISNNHIFVFVLVTYITVILMDNK